MFKSQSVDKMLSSEGERKCFWLYWELQLRKNLINVSKETDQKFLLNLFCNYEIQPKRLHSNLTFQTPSAKRTAIQHLSCSSPRTPERAARDIPVSQTGAAMAGQLSEQSKVVILAKCSCYTQLTHQNTWLDLRKWKSYRPWLSQRCHINWTMLPSLLGFYGGQSSEGGRTKARNKG